VTQLDLNDFSAHVVRELPSYARPILLRIHPEMEVTGTFKLVKGDLRKEGYDPDVIKEPLLVLNRNRARAVDRIFARIRSRPATGRFPSTRQTLRPQRQTFGDAHKVIAVDEMCTECTVR
jgi:hypothetical protein